MDINGDINNNNIDISFIPVTKVKATEGYKIPDAFTLRFENNENINLSGIWISKYELTK